MEAHPRTLKQVFRADLRLTVPLFQRRYVWNADEHWAPLWEDVLVTLDRIRGDDAVPHFLGAVVLEHVRRPTGTIEVRQVIDGQQRLTTLQVAIAAVRDVAQGRSADPKLVRRLSLLLRNDEDLIDGEDEAYKLWPTNADRADYAAVMRGVLFNHSGKTTDLGRISQAYLFFRDAAESFLADQAPDEIDEAVGDLSAVLAGGLEVVVIDLGPEDNAQVIFETLNARGTPLLASDLVKNFLFRTLDEGGRAVERLYAEHWRAFEAEEWQRDVRLGRLLRPRLDVFMNYFLVVLLEREVLSHQLFPAIRAHVGQSPDCAEETLASMSAMASVFDRLERRTDVTPEESAALDRLEIADTQTVMPVLLWLFTNARGESRETAVLALESYLVRRTLCRLTAKNFNRLFLELLRRLARGDRDPGELVTSFLAGQTSDSGVWPSDEELFRSVRSLPLFRLLKRERLKKVLVALETAARDSRTEHWEFTNKLTIEHLLPQQWQTTWPITATSREEVEVATRRRHDLVHTLGNLTLTTQPLNSALSNGAWSAKREQILRSSALTINRELPTHWDEDAILARGERLADLARRVWRRPPVDDRSFLFVDEASRDLRPDREEAARPIVRQTRSKSAPRKHRDLGRHISEAFETVPAGTFLTVAEIRRHRSSEYGDELPSAGAISARLFPASGRCTIAGLQPEVANGVRGARKTGPVSASPPAYPSIGESEHATVRRRLRAVENVGRYLADE